MLTYFVIFCTILPRNHPSILIQWQKLPILKTTSARSTERAHPYAPGHVYRQTGRRLGADDGIYILLKEVIDNSIDEYVMGHGRDIDLKIEEGLVSIRDYGRGIPLGKVVDCVSKINTGGKYDSKAFKKSVGLNGVGTQSRECPFGKLPGNIHPGRQS